MGLEDNSKLYVSQLYPRGEGDDNATLSSWEQFSLGVFVCLFQCSFRVASGVITSALALPITSV
jgi:hypothetical protein